MCGCNKRNAVTPVNRAVTSTSIRPASVVRSAAAPTHITNLNGGSVSSATEISRQRIQRLRREAVQRTFGK